jgi:outer membrane murein-binding lipoprotein Lpp
MSFLGPPTEGSSSNDPVRAIGSLVTKVDKLRSDIGDLNLAIDKLQVKINNLKKELKELE